jgi:serine/threonine protein phosphatase 1
VFSRLFPKKAKLETMPSTGGRLVYAVGDVHGRLDALDPLIQAIARDALALRPKERPLLIFLGDYVDRGPASAEVVDRILKLKRLPAFEVRTLKGNHEEALLQFLEEPEFGPTWTEHGAAATLTSYGVEPPVGRDDAPAWEAARQALVAAIPAAHLKFYNGLELMITVGDYVFVHAGLRPGVALERQTERDLLWIRTDFTQARGPFEKIVVHGHTPTEDPQIMPHRMGIDTGVYATGVLTAVRLDDEGHVILQSKIGRQVAA